MTKKPRPAARRAAAQLAPREDIAFSSGGERIAAWHYPAAPGAPCVILAHGFCGVRELRLDAYAERFQRAGYHALVFDYRHFGASDGEPRQLLSIRRELEDWRAALRFARSHPGIAADRIAIWGTSLGGGHVLTIAAEDHHLAAVIAQVPFTDGLASSRTASVGTALRLMSVAIRDAVGALAGKPPVYVPAIGPPGALAAMTAPDCEPGYRKLIPPGLRFDERVAARVFLEVGMYRPITGAARIQAPLLLQVAEHDSLAPAASAKEVARRARRARLEVFPLGHFDVYVGEPFETAVASQVRFLEEVMPSPSKRR